MHFKLLASYIQWYGSLARPQNDCHFVHLHSSCARHFYATATTSTSAAAMRVYSSSAASCQLPAATLCQFVSILCAFRFSYILMSSHLLCFLTRICGWLSFTALMYPLSRGVSVALHPRGLAAKPLPTFIRSVTKHQHHRMSHRTAAALAIASGTLWHVDDDTQCWACHRNNKWNWLVLCMTWPCELMTLSFSPLNSFIYFMWKCLHFTAVVVCLSGR